MQMLMMKKKKKEQNNRMNNQKTEVGEVRESSADANNETHEKQVNRDMGVQ